MRPTLRRSLIAPLLCAACVGPTEEPPREAVAVIEPRGSARLEGFALLREEQGGVRVALDVHSAPPGPHGVHVHEGRSCEGVLRLPVGGHFDPAGMPHGRPGGVRHHAGDLPNLEVGADGLGRLDAFLAGVTLGEGPRSIAGRAVVVRERPDDFATQPDGDCGPPIGCGLIRLR